MSPDWWPPGSGCANFRIAASMRAASADVQLPLGSQDAHFLSHCAEKMKLLGSKKLVGFNIFFQIIKFGIMHIEIRAYLPEGTRSTFWGGWRTQPRRPLTAPACHRHQRLSAMSKILNPLKNLPGATGPASLSPLYACMSLKAQPDGYAKPNAFQACDVILSVCYR